MTEHISSFDEARKRQSLKEERKKVLKICVSKLQLIADPESYLCRSVLINNTLKSIQQENRQYLRQRARLKRQKDRIEEEDETEIKKKCLEEDDDGEHRNEELNLDDTKSPLITSYFDVDSYSTEVIEDVVFSDNIDNTKASVVSEDDNSDDSISASMNISITPVVREDSDDKEDLSSDEEFSNNNRSCRTNSNKHPSDKFTDPIIHNKSIESC